MLAACNWDMDPSDSPTFPLHQPEAHRGDARVVAGHTGHYQPSLDVKHAETLMRMVVQDSND